MVGTAPTHKPNRAILSNPEVTERPWEVRQTLVKQFPLVAAVRACVVPYKPVYGAPTGAPVAPVVSLPILVLTEADTPLCECCLYLCCCHRGCHGSSL